MTDQFFNKRPCEMQSEHILDRWQSVDLFLIGRFLLIVDHHVIIILFARKFGENVE